MSEGFRSKPEATKISEAEMLTEVDREKELSEMSFAERTSYFLNSEKSISFLKELPQEHKERFIGLLVQYLVLDKDGEYFFDYVDQLRILSPLYRDMDTSEGAGFKDKKVNSLITLATKKLGLKEVDSEEAKEALFQYFSENLIIDGYCYHGFNGVFEDSIREHGLDPHMRTWDWKELDEIKEIFTKTGWSTALGWSHINSQGKVSVSADTKQFYRYALASPEWFAQFVAEGWHVPSNTDGYDKNAYYRRDYNAAKQNIILFCQQLKSRKQEDIDAKKAYPNITPTEEVKILAFFEKYWKIFANEKAQPKLALIKNKAVQRDGLTYDSYQEYCEETRALTKKMGFRNHELSIQDYIKLCIDSLEIDRQLKEPISKDNISIISLPEFNKIQ